MTQDSSNEGKNIDLEFPPSPRQRTERIRITTSDGFSDWLSNNRFSIAFNTYNIGKLFMVGVNPTGQLSISEASFRRAMGLALHKGTLWMAGHRQVWRFENFLDPGQMSQGNDAVFAPVGATTTGMVNLHDVRVSDKGVFFASCNFNCIGRLHEKWSFEPFWKPPFITEFTFGDRCHLNCFALENGVPRYVTCFSGTNENLAWRDLPSDQDHGVLIDILSNQIICRNLSMPHSPQMHGDRLYLANSGKGEFGEVDLKTGHFRPICFLPGFTRGIAFHKNYALIGTSKAREQGVFEGNKSTILAQKLAESGMTAECGITVLNLKTETIEHSLKIDGVASEIYDICVLPGLRRPSVVDLEGTAMNSMFRPSHLFV